MICRVKYSDEYICGDAVGVPIRNGGHSGSRCAGILCNLGMSQPFCLDGREWREVAPDGAVA